MIIWYYTGCKCYIISSLNIIFISKSAEGFWSPSSGDQKRKSFSPRSGPFCPIFSINVHELFLGDANILFAFHGQIYTENRFCRCHVWCYVQSHVLSKSCPMSCLMSCKFTLGLATKFKTYSPLSEMGFGQAEQHSTLILHMFSCLYSTVQPTGASLL